MLNGRQVIALIPARGGSKRIPQKNIKPLLGKPLISWTIETAQQVPEIDLIIVSTDDPLIAQVASQHQVMIRHRPPELAQDESLPSAVVKDTLTFLAQKGVKGDYLLYLQPTSPLRLPEDIQNCLHLLADPHHTFASTATFCEAALHPQLAWRIVGDRGYPYRSGDNPWQPRQQRPTAYQLNGAVYAIAIDALNPDQPAFLPQPIGAVIMPVERSVDIDELPDFFLAEWLLRRQG